MPVFAKGDRITNASGSVRAIVEYAAEDGSIDIRLQPSGTLVRNCLPAAWRPTVGTIDADKSEVDKPAPETPIARHDPCHIVIKWEGDFFQRNGWLLGWRWGPKTKLAFIMFEDMDSAEVPMSHVAKHHGPNPW